MKIMKEFTELKPEIYSSLKDKNNKIKNILLKIIKTVVFNDWKI